MTDSKLLHHRTLPYLLPRSFDGGANSEANVKFDRISTKRYIQMYFIKVKVRYG